MPENMFPFPSPFGPSGRHISGLSPADMTDMAISVDLLFDFLKKSGIKRRIELPEENSTTLPLELALSLLRPDEIEKLKRYIASYEEDAPDR